MFATSAAIFSLLLVLTGLAKIRRPLDVERALTSLGVLSFPGLGVGLGLIELGVGFSALLWAPWFAVQGVAYLVFAGWVSVALVRKVPIASCGCLGRDDTPPSVGHVVLNLFAAVVSLGATTTQQFVLYPGLAGAAQLFVIAIGLYLSYVVLTDGARLSGARSV